MRSGVGKEWAEGGISGNFSAEPDRQQQDDDTEDRSFTDLAGPYIAHIDPHGYRQRDGSCNSKGTPRAFAERLDHDQTEGGKDDDHDCQSTDQSDTARYWSHFHLDHFAKRTAVTTHRAEQHHEVLHRTSEDDTRQNPDGAR